uniref:Pentacotripeptide-repeat region of PRORP domain-containing protein n=1 Tax=Opuntia streptacantha TaxID=393608 RepID=A0A7C9ABV8_OPUST
MFRTRDLLYHHGSPLVNQVLAAMIRDRPFDATLAIAAAGGSPWTTEIVSEVLRSMPTVFFLPTRSIGRQHNPTRHRAPLKQRNLRVESEKLQKGSLVLGPAAHRDSARIDFGVSKTTEFFYWVESHSGFTHGETTVKEMAMVLAKANKLKELWDFLKDMSRRESGLVTTMSITCLIKCLGEEGLVNEAMHAFYRMKQFHCKPDVYAYNTMIYALCRVGFFKKAKFLLQQMELPGFRCPPDVYTYTILISSYCKYSMQTGCKKAIRRRLWEANHLFRLMLFKGFVPDIVTYNSLIDGCCKTYRIDRALELFEDMKKRGCTPNRVTYDSFIRYYSVVNEIDKAIEMLRSMQGINHGMPTTSSYTPIIHALCESGRVAEAWEFLIELVGGGSIPREYTYKLVCGGLYSQGKADLLDERICGKIEGGIVTRYKQKMKVKPVMSRKNSALLVDD